MKTILRAYRKLATGKLQLALELNLDGKKVQETPADPPQSGFDRIVLFDVNQSPPPPAPPRPLLILDVLPQNEDGRAQISVSSDRKEIQLDCLIRCLLRKREAKPVIRFKSELEVSNNGQIVFDSLSLICPPRLPGIPESSADLLTIDDQPIEALRNKTVVISGVGGAPDLATRLGLQPEAPDDFPATLPQDVLSKLQVTFGCVDETGLPSQSGAIHLVFARRMAVLRTDHTLLSPAPDLRVSRCNADNIWLDDARLSICKKQVEALDLHNTLTAQLTIIQRQPLNRDAAKYDELPLGQWVANLTGIPHISALQLWNNAIARPYLNALHTVQDGRPVSFMPVWEFNSQDDSLQDPPREPRPNLPASTPPDPPLKAPRWVLMAKLSDGSRNIDFQDFDTHSDKLRADFISLRVRSLYPAESDFPVKAELPGFLSQTGEPLHLVYRLVSTQFNNNGPDELKIEKESLPFSFRMEHLPGNQDEQLSRVGALDLIFPDRATITPRISDDQLSADSQLKVCFRKAALGDPYAAELLTVNIKGRLALFDLMPGGQDDLPGEEFVASEAQGACSTDTPTSEEQFEAELEQRFQRKRPLLIPFPAPLANALTKNSDNRSPLQPGEKRKPEFILDYDERTEAAQSQTLSMRLIEYQGGGNSSQTRGKQRLIVLDTQPFLIAMVEAPAFAGQLDKEGIREIGNWSGTSDQGANWELVGSTDGFNIFLPPQGVGEAMEKWKLTGEFEDLPNDQPIDFRFSPLARFNLLPSYFKQRFAEAPWNLRRILGFPGQRAPGAGVVDMRFEMLYGMTCSVTYPFLRLAELESKLGRIPGRLSRELQWIGTSQQELAYKNFRREWAELYRRYLSRLSVLEAWGANQPANLVVRDGITYELRKTAKLRYPISPKLVPSDDVRRTNTPHSKDGLAGGVSWGFESANIYDKLWKEPKSLDGSQLANPYFSALGGWGNQKAVFDGGLTTIYANVAMGRTYFYSIERIGRIGVFWNLAKHVIIYERTVAPTKQFKGKQDDHLRRPLLRKVREFVELLQPVRKYPEFGAEPVSRGFVTGTEFKSRIINVDSDWGNDIANEGWQVPLWNIQASQEKPDVYPKPHILLEVAADAESGGGTINVELEEPEKLVFFTRTADDPQPADGNGVKTDERANTDKWPAVRNIDFPDQPMPVRPNIPAFDPANLDRTLPDAAAIEPGYEQFTFAVAPASRQINLVAERATETMNAALRNVTMVRARARKLADFAEGKQPQVQQTLESLKTLSRVTEQVEGILQQILVKMPKDGNVTTESVEELKKTIDALIAENKQPGGLADNVTKLGGQVSSLFRSKDKFCGLLNIATDEAIDQAAARVFKLFDQVEKDLLTAIGEFALISTNLKDSAIAAVSEQFRRVEEIFAVINTGLEELLRQIETGYQAALDFKTQAEREINVVIDLADKLLAENSQRARQEIEELRRKLQSLLRNLESASRSGTNGKLGELIEKVRQGVVNLGRMVDDKLGAIDKKIEQGATSVKTELTQFKTGLSTEFAKLQNDLTALRAEIQNVIKAAQAEINKPRQIVTDLQTNLTKAINDVQQVTIDTLNQAVTLTISQARADFTQAVATAKAKVRELACNLILPKLLDEVDEFGKKLTGLLTGGATGAEHFLEKLKQQLNQAIGKPFADLRREVERAFDDIRFRLAPFAERVNEILTDLADLAGDTLHQIGDGTLRLLRAFGDAPRVPMLDFNRLRLAYFFDELTKHVDLTPVTALFNRLGDDLKGLGLRFPVAKLLDRLVPDALENFDLSKILPDFAGLKLDRLFSGLKFPLLPKLPNVGNGENVKVMHGIDKQARRAWVRATIDVPLTQEATVFSFGPIEVKLANARFNAVAMITIELGNAPKLKVEGKVTGDWKLIIAGTNLVTFRETSLTFDDSGRIRFNISADKIEMTGALKFLADLLKSKLLGDQGKEPPIRLIFADNKPVGVEAVFNLPRLDLQFGAFGIGNLNLGSAFRLMVVPKDGGIDFALGVALNFSQKEAPFTLTIFILGGGGWLDTRLTYYAISNRLLGDITIGITASASLAIALGPIKGSISITFGIYADFHIDTQGGSSFAITLMLLLKGEAVVLSMISVSISLLLEAQYSSDGSLVGRGTLKIRVKICWCFTFKFSKTVTYTFKKGSGSQAAIAESFELTALAAGDQFDRAARAYLEMFE